MTRRQGLALLGFLAAFARPDRLGAASPTLELARRQPILDGEGAAGIKLGDSAEKVRHTLGRPPDRREDHPALSFRIDLFEVAPSDRVWVMVLALTYALDHAGLGAIRGLAMRKGAGALPYSGKSRRGYGLDDGAARLGQLYGKPDATFQASPSDPAFWWYRSAGLIISPAYEADYRLAQFVVLRPGLPADQARRFILAQ